MYKIIILDQQGNILDHEFYLSNPSDSVIYSILKIAWDRFKVKVTIKVINDKYSVLVKAA